MEKIKPMLATLAKEPFDDSDWLFEIKWDGYRAIADTREGQIELYSRYGNSFKKDFKEIAKALESIPKETVLDGEIVVFGDNGKPSFEMIQNYKMAREGELGYMVLDVLYTEGESLMGRPLLERKKILGSFSLPKIIQKTDYIQKEGKEFFARLKQADFEGMMAKNASSRYFPGKRSREWLKVKIHLQQEAVIAGFTDPGGAREGFGSLVLGVYEDKELVYIGNAGTGFSEKRLEDLTRILKEIEVETPPFYKPPKINNVHWVKPVLVCEVKFQEWTRDKRMRQPVFLGLREDKKQKEVVREVPINRIMN